MKRSAHEIHGGEDDDAPSKKKRGFKITFRASKVEEQQVALPPTPAAASEPPTPLPEDKDAGDLPEEYADSAL